MIETKHAKICVLWRINLSFLSPSRYFHGWDIIIFILAGFLCGIILLILQLCISYNVMCIVIYHVIMSSMWNYVIIYMIEQCSSKVYTYVCHRSIIQQGKLNQAFAGLLLQSSPSACEVYNLPVPRDIGNSFLTDKNPLEVKVCSCIRG